MLTGNSHANYRRCLKKVSRSVVGPASPAEARKAYGFLTRNIFSSPRLCLGLRGQAPTQVKPLIRKGHALPRIRRHSRSSTFSPENLLGSDTFLQTIWHRKAPADSAWGRIPGAR